jgi:hypothetical protein
VVDARRGEQVMASTEDEIMHAAGDGCFEPNNLASSQGYAYPASRRAALEYSQSLLGVSRL